MEAQVQIKWQGVEAVSEASYGEELTSDEIKKENIFKP